MLLEKNKYDGVTQETAMDASREERLRKKFREKHLNRGLGAIMRAKMEEERSLAMVRVKDELTENDTKTRQRGMGVGGFVARLRKQLKREGVIWMKYQEC